MKHLLSLSLVFLFLNLSAQSKWSVGVVGGVDVFSLSSGHYIDPSFGNLSSNSNSLADFGVRQRDLVRYGAILGYQIKDKLIIRGGVVFTAEGEQIGSEIRWPSEFDAMGVYTNDPLLPDVQGIQDKHRYLEVPFRLRTYLPESKLRWYIEGGISPSFYLNSTTQAIVDGFGVIEESSGKYPWINKVNVSFDLGFGAQLGLGEKVNIFVQPMIRYFPESIFRLVIRNGYNVGIEVGCSYALN